MVLPDRLPQALRIAGHLVPSTYAASAFRQTLIGPVTPKLALDLIVLGGVTVASLWLVGRGITWRQN